MPYTAKDATKTLLSYLKLPEVNARYIDNTSNRGLIYTLPDETKCVIFIYPISHKDDDSKNFFDTRDSGAKERNEAWKYSCNNGLKYFCLAVHDRVDKYKDYIFSLECDEETIEDVSGTVDGSRAGKGTQVVIPNTLIPKKPYERILTRAYRQLYGTYRGVCASH